ncbi:hypothetical protein [Flavobacterium silvaticum]|uniref:DUF4252 domain-containing protein n=1 Tax=Flavobacterium silvaticum TaxID=1852020 RepID=A0A972JG46_9FLAO|nr:hypothetical protein [Flavobacterium silvaticum]NMH26475.1 hypothetical protein [Flavobacterium silvaticum]
MKKIFSLIFIVTLSCNSQTDTKKTLSCQSVEIKTLSEFEKLFLKFDNTALFQEELGKFNQNIETGILLVKFLPGMELGDFTTIQKSDNGWLRLSKHESDKNILLSKAENNFLSEKVQNNKDIFFYEQCNDIAASTFYLILVKKDKNVIIGYLLNGEIQKSKNPSNNKLELLRKILSIAYSNSFL